ncbi:helix-turn-helix transcriptional regulator, partial [Aquimarina sp. BL5]|uniref:helix-turn-helix transcriptional regulator n=2 Tax=Aquimarina sp. BL5 TaxID=1714860 RepID=UPI001F1AA26B
KYRFVYNLYNFYLYEMPERLNRIKEILVIQDVSQKDLAKRLGKNPNTIASICNNKSQPHLKDLKLIAEILDVDIRELLVPTKSN